MNTYFLKNALFWRPGLDCIPVYRNKSAQPWPMAHAVFWLPKGRWQRSHELTVRRRRWLPAQARVLAGAALAFPIRRFILNRWPSVQRAVYLPALRDRLGVLLAPEGCTCRHWGRQQESRSSGGRGSCPARAAAPMAVPVQMGVCRGAAARARPLVGGGWGRAALGAVTEGSPALASVLAPGGQRPGGWRLLSCGLWPAGSEACKH